jgi:23S rRNA (adenine2503-C2)-methyltransferase
MRDTASKTGAPIPRIDLAELDRPALEEVLAERGHERFRARQIFRWVYRRGVADLDAMTTFRAICAALAADFISTPVIVCCGAIVDGTESSCFGWPTEGRSNRSSFQNTPAMTFCISTQVGAMACASA